MPRSSRLPPCGRHSSRCRDPTREEKNPVLATCLRGAMSAARLELLPGDHVRVKLKRPWRDGTESVRYSLDQFLVRLAAIIPLPRRPAVIYFGAFAPNAK